MYTNQIFLNLRSLLSDYLYHWAILVNDYWWLPGLIAGFSLSLAILLENISIKSSLTTVWLLTVISQPVLYLFLPDWSASLWIKPYSLADRHIYGYVAGSLGSAVMGFFLYRLSSSKIDELKQRLSKTSSLERDQNTDIRDLGQILPTERRDYAPEKYFNDTQIFIGLDSRNKPVRIDSSSWRSKHTDLIGTTGSGKGVAAQLLLSQASNQGEAVIVLDPKDDEFLPHVLGHAAERAGVPFVHIDLTGEVGQWHPAKDKTPIQFEEMLSAAFGLAERGTDADFYRLNDRKAARAFANQINTTATHTFPQCVANFFSEYEELLKDAPKFREDLEEISSQAVLDTHDGLDLEKAIELGAVIYVRGSMRNTRILKLQKMFVLSVIQHCESRDRAFARHVCLFLDEFKYLISKPALEALGAIRDKHAHVILAHQSLGDLRDCPKDIDPDSVIASINENCSLKLTYRVNDPNTADWMARMSGKILVDQELRRFSRNAALAEINTQERSLRQTERCLIDTNMLQSLPPRCAVLFGNGLADFIFTSPIQVEKSDRWSLPTRFDPHENTRHKIQKSTSIAEDLLNVD